MIEPLLGDPHGALFGSGKALGTSGATVPDSLALDGVEAESGAAGGTGSPAAGRVGMNHGGEFTKLLSLKQPRRAYFSAELENLRTQATTSRVPYLT